MDHVKQKVIVTYPIPQEAVDVLRKIDDVQVNPHNRAYTKLEIMEAVRDADGALVCLGTDPFDRETIDSAKRLKVIARHGVGVDNVDIEAATERGILVTNTPGANTTTVAEFTVGLMIALLRKIPQANLAVRSGRWATRWDELVGEDLEGKMLGIIGLGRIGKEVAKRAKAFNTNITYYDIIRDEPFEKQWNIKFVHFTELLKTSDIVTIHVLLTEQTRGMIGEKEMGLMKKTAFLINTSRGPVIDQKAVYRALEQKTIAGAALDVFVQEPPALNDPLLKLSNVILTPHLASASVESKRKMAIEAAESITMALSGKIPANVVNPEVLSSRKFHPL